VFGREAWRHGGMGAGRQGSGGMVPVNRMITINVTDYTAGMYISVARDLRGRRFAGKFVVVR